MELFRRLPSNTSNQVRDERAIGIRDRWLNKNYFFGDKGPATTAAQQQVCFRSSPIVTQWSNVSSEI